MPPGFELVRADGADAFAAAVADASAGADPGRMHWRDGAVCAGAVVLTPERAVLGETVEHLALLALYDALATVAPPQVPVDLVLPGTVLVDGGRVGGVRVEVGEGWAVAGFEVAMRSEAGDPGERPGETCLMEEGFGDVSGADVLGYFCRHLLVWVDAWQDEGGAGLARAVRQRMRVPA